MTVRRLAFLLPLVLFAAACGGDDADDADDAAPEDEESTEEDPAPEEPLRILVSNDDGVGGEGIAALVEGLSGLDDVEVTVVAPAENRSGSGSTTSPSPPEASPAELVDGTEAIAVDGFPADSVLHGLTEVVEEPPHLVVSGINEGQNLGPIAAGLSGTVGAALTAAAEGVPALAVSQGLGEPPDYPTAVELAVDWVEEHREALLAGEVGTDVIANLNVPTCAEGEIRGVIEVPTATDATGRDPIGDAGDCTSTATNPADDIAAFLTGYAPLAEIPVP